MQWCKKINGKIHYFGRLADAQAALDRYLRERDYLLAGRTPPAAAAEGVTVADMANAFLTSKKRMMESGELQARSFKDYYESCKMLVDHFGRAAIIENLGPQDFARFRQQLAKGASGGTVPGVQLYLKEIRYTGFEGTEGPYSVVFTRDHGVRPDVMIDCRSGFKMVTADRLARIDVKLNDELIRSYEFEYEIGAFQKSLLKSITQRGTQDEFFNKHEFEYFDEVTADPASPTILTGFYSVPEIGGATTIAGDGVLLAGTNSTALEAELTSSSEVHGSAGVSLGGLIGFGGNGGSGSADSVTDLTLLDINGDGLPDQLYERDGTVFFRRNTGGPTSTPDFGDEVELPSLTRIGTEHSDTTTYGGSVTVLAKLSDEKSSTQTYGHAYLTDVNGDLLPDLVLEGQIYFNRLDRVVSQELSEQETVDKYETPAARILGEPIRERYGQHGGQPEFKKGPAYHKKDQ